MTEKRYEYCRGKYKQYIQDIEKDGVWREGYLGTYGEFDLDKITVLLNELNDENKQLKTLVDFYKDFQKDARELAKENEELKSELKIYRKIANCRNCHYHNYDWYDDGDEFEVCDKGNDMSDWICKDWREL